MVRHDDQCRFPAACAFRRRCVLQIWAGSSMPGASAHHQIPIPRETGSANSHTGHQSALAAAH